MIYRLMAGCGEQKDDVGDERVRQEIGLHPEFAILADPRHYGSILVPSTFRNCAIQAGCAGQAGAVTSLPEV